MQKTLITGLFVAVGAGLAVGTQATLLSQAGRTVETLVASSLAGLTAGVIGIVMALFLAGRLEALGWSALREAAPFIIGAGLCVLIILSGVTFAMSRTGVAAGLAAVLLGQMSVGVAADTLGLGGVEPSPLSLTRLGGLALLVAATWLLSLE